MSVVFRDMTVADVEEGLRLSRASGWNQTAEDWRLMLALGPGLFRVGVENGRAVATGGAVRYGRDLAWICMILVAPESRGRGLGTQVFDEVLARVAAARERDGLQVVGLDATPAGRGIYVQRGFVDGPGLVRMRREPAAAGPAAGFAFAPASVAGLAPDESAVRAMQPSDLEAVLDLDRLVFGADRGLVLRDALASAPALAFVAAADGLVDGYCLGRHGDHSDHVGPVVAGYPALGQALVAAAAATAAPGRPVIVDARAEWSGELEALGFSPQRPLTRMYLAGARPRAAAALELAIRGPEMG